MFPVTANGTDWASSPGFQGLLGQILDGVATPIYVKNHHHQWLFANQACWRLLGRSPQALTPLSELADSSVHGTAVTLTEAEIWSQEQLTAVTAQDQALASKSLEPLTVTLTDGEGRLRQFKRRVESATTNPDLLICFLDPCPDLAPLVKTPQFETLLANIPAIIYRCYADADGTFRFAFVSPGAFAIAGMPAETIQAEPQRFIDCIHPLDRPSFQATLKTAIQAAKPWQWEGRYYKPSGELRWFHTAAQPQPQPEGVLLWDGLLMDITHDKQVQLATLERAVMEQALADNETRFRTMAATIPGALFQLRVQGEAWRIDYISDRSQDILGVSAQAITADIAAFLERVHPSDRPRLAASITQTVADQSPWSYEGRCVTPGGITRWWRGDGIAVPETPDTMLLCGVILDITARKTVEEAYRDSEHRLRMALDVSDMGVWTWDVVTDEMTWGAEVEKLFGPTARDFCQTFVAYLQQVHPDDRGALQQIVDQTLHGGEDYRIEYRLCLPDDIIRWVGERGGLWRDEEGQVLGLAGTVVDITESKAAATALQASETRYRTLLDNIPGAVYRRRADPDLTLLFQSEAIADITGYPVNHDVHHHGITLMHPDDRPRIQQVIQQSLDPPQPFDVEYRILHADGRILWVQDKGQPVPDAAGAYTLIDGVLMDINRRKESENRYRDLARREALINRISAQIRESLTLETILQTAVQATRRQLDTDRVVIYRFNAEWQGHVVVEDVVAPWASTLGDMGSDDCFATGYAGYYESGRVRAIDDVTEAGLDPCHQAFLTDLQIRANLIAPILIQNRLWGLLIAHECRGPRRWNGSEIELLLSLAGQVGVAIGQSDLYYEAQKNAAQARQQAQDLAATLLELQRTQAQLVQTEKMSSLGQLVAGVAHEINNPVSFIDGNLSHAGDYAQDLMTLIQLYQRTYPDSTGAIAQAIQAIDLEFLMEDFPRLLESMRVGADRIKKIVASLRIFSRMDEADIKPVDIHDGLNSTLMILGNRLKANGDRPEMIVCQDYGELPPVECYAGQLNQVFMNLLSNAIDALEEHLATDDTLVPHLSICTRVVELDQIAITIADNGPGIPESLQSRIFEPFYTTKPVGKGTGIGLSISHQIVTERHRGTLECRSATNQGTQFIITIPQVQGTT
jgi:PAS domain S-box-containing protein